MTLLTGLLMAALAQGGQEDIKRLVAELGAERIDRRETAEAALRKLGTRALPALEAASSSRSPEVAQRARWLVSRITDDVAHLRVLGPVRRVTLSMKKMTFREVLREIDQQTGFQTRFHPPSVARPLPRFAWPRILAIGTGRSFA